MNEPDISKDRIAVELYENALLVGFDPITAIAISTEMMKDIEDFSLPNKE